MDSGVAYSGPGQARVFFKPYDTAATLVISVDGSSMTDLSIHPRNPLTNDEQSSAPFLRTPCRIGNLQTIESKNAVVTITKLLIEAFAPAQGETKEAPGTDFRAKLRNSRLEAALTKMSSPS